MDKQTWGTFFTRVVVILSTTGVVLLNTRYLGISGQGTASLINFGILLVLSLSNFIGGGAIVYLVPRMKEGEVVWPAVLWAVCSAIIFYALFTLFPIVPKEFILHTSVLGLLQSLSLFIQQISLGKEQVNRYNLAMMVQSLSGVSFLFIFFFFIQWHTAMAFVASLYLSFSASLVFIALKEKQYLIASKIGTLKPTAVEIFRYGKYAQSGNILHLLNQRLNIVFLENMLVTGRMFVGLYSIVLYIGEAVWSVSKSLSLVQYARIANTEDHIEQRWLTRRNLRISLLFVTTCSIVLLFIPDSLYLLVFGREVNGLQYAMVWFVPGMVANSASIIYAHYFSGRGLHRDNAVASALGLVFGTLSAIIFIPQMQVAGAALAISTALCVQAAYFFIRYKRAVSR